MNQYHAKGTLAGIMAVLLGFLSRPCCSIPFLLALFGVGSAGLVDLLLPYRHLFLVISVIAFSISGWMVFRVEGALFNKIFFIASVLFTITFLFPPKLILTF